MPTFPHSNVAMHPSMHSALHGTAWHCMALHGTAWYCMALHVLHLHGPPMACIPNLLACVPNFGSTLLAHIILICHVTLLHYTRVCHVVHHPVPCFNPHKHPTWGQNISMHATHTKELVSTYGRESPKEFGDGLTCLKS